MSAGSAAAEDDGSDVDLALHWWWWQEARLSLISLAKESDKHAKGGGILSRGGFRWIPLTTDQDEKGIDVTAGAG